jgi:hypothetical protein
VACVIGSWRVRDGAAIATRRARTSVCGSVQAAIGARRRPDVTRHPRLASARYHEQKWANSWIERSHGHAPP